MDRIGIAAGFLMRPEWTPLLQSKEEGGKDLFHRRTAHACTAL